MMCNKQAPVDMLQWAHRS